MPGPREDALSDRGRSGLRSALRNDWEERCTMFLDSQAPKVTQTSSHAKPCQQLGFCVCKGIGASAKLFAAALVAFLKPLFTPPKKRKQKQQPIKQDTDENPVNLLASVQLEPEPEPPHVKRLRANKKLLIQGMIVFKISKQGFLALSDAAAAGLDVLGLGWAEFAARELQADASQTPEAAEPAADEKDEFWFHIGYVNLKVWSLSFLRLVPRGPPDAQGFQRLDVKSIFVDQAILCFAKLIPNESFRASWNIELFLIQTDPNKMLHGPDTRPNWVTVKQFQPNPDLKGIVCFWSGLEEELKKQQRQQRKKKQSSNRKTKKNSSAALTYRLSKPGTKTSKRFQKNKKSFAATVSMARARAARKSKQTEDKDTETEDEELPRDQLQQEILEVEDRLSEQDGGETIRANPQEDMAAHTNPKDDVADNAQSEASELDLSDIEEAVVMSVIPDGNQAAQAALDAHPIPSNSSTETRAKDCDEKQPASQAVPAMASPADADRRSNANTPSAPPPSAEPRRVAGDRRAALGPDMSISVSENTEIRYNELSQRLVAVCKAPGHGDCRRSRTINAGNRLGQGRPLGLLTYWLLQAPNHADAASHRRLLDAPVDLEARREARRVFKLIRNSNLFLEKERDPVAPEDEEPNFIT